MTALNNEDILSLIGLGIVSTAFGFSGFYLLIKRAGARVRDNRGCGFSSRENRRASDHWNYSCAPWHLHYK